MVTPDVGAIMRIAWTMDVDRNESQVEVAAA